MKWELAVRPYDIEGNEKIDPEGDGWEPIGLATLPGGTQVILWKRCLFNNEDVERAAVTTLVAKVAEAAWDSADELMGPALDKIAELEEECRRLRVDGARRYQRGYQSGLRRQRVLLAPETLGVLQGIG